MSEPMKTPPLAAEAGEEKAMLKAQRDLWIERASLWQHEANERGEELAAKRAALLRAESELEQVKAERDRLRELLGRLNCANPYSSHSHAGDECLRCEIEAVLGEKGSKS